VPHHLRKREACPGPRPCLKCHPRPRHTRRSPRVAAPTLALSATAATSDSCDGGVGALEQPVELQIHPGVAPAPSPHVGIHVISHGRQQRVKRTHRELRFRFRFRV
jgi:hypothetical protein